jgi:hypothetical protein
MCQLFLVTFRHIIIVKCRNIAAIFAIISFPSTFYKNQFLTVIDRSNNNCHMTAMIYFISTMCRIIHADFIL